MSIAVPRTRKVSDWQQSAHLGIDDVGYDLFIRQEADDFYALWVCQTCCQQSTWRAKAKTREAAIERAKIGAQVHHSFTHLRDRTRKTVEFDLLVRKKPR